jgi:ABC-2 type transport system permease protein
MKNWIITRSSPYLQIMHMGAQINFLYRANVFFQIAGVILQIYFLKVIWTAIYVQNHTAGLSTLISYLTVSNLQVWILSPTITTVLQERVRKGDIALDIAKPISFVGQFLARQLGTSLSMIPFAILMLPLVWLAGGLEAPASPEALLGYLVSCLLAYGVVSLLALLMGLISFWTLELSGLQLMYRFVNQLFAGALIPLWLFPPVLHTLALFLPFQAVAFLPVSIYLGQVQGMGIVSSLLIQVAWVVFLSALVQFTWFRARLRVVVQGG